MRKLRLSLVLFTAYIMLFFNLERLEGQAGIQGVATHTFVYGLMFIIAASFLLLQNPQRFSVFAYIFGWLVIYLLLRLTVFNDKPVFDGIEKYITLTEFTIIIFANITAYFSSSYITEFEKIIEEIFIPSVEQRILKFETSKEEVDFEFVRSRRQNIPMSLILINPIELDKKHPLLNKKIVEDVQKYMTKRFITASIAKIIVLQARRNDSVISRGEDGQYLILSPDTDGENIKILAERINGIVQKQLGIPMIYGLSSFPDQEVTFEGLIKKAENDLNNKLKTNTISLDDSLPTNLDQPGSS